VFNSRRDVGEQRAQNVRAVSSARQLIAGLNDDVDTGSSRRQMCRLQWRIHGGRPRDRPLCLEGRRPTGICAKLQATLAIRCAKLFSFLAGSIPNPVLQGFRLLISHQGLRALTLPGAWRPAPDPIPPCFQNLGSATG